MDRIPPELREIIFEYALLADGGVFIFRRGGMVIRTLKLLNPNKNLLSLLPVSSQIYKETATKPFKINRFRIERATRPEEIMKELHAFFLEGFQRASIRHLELDISIMPVMQLGSSANDADGGLLNTIKGLFPGVEKVDFYQDVNHNTSQPQVAIVRAMRKWKDQWIGTPSVKEKPAVAFYVRLFNGTILPYRDPDTPASSAAAPPAAA